MAAAPGSLSNSKDAIKTFEIERQRGSALNYQKTPANIFEEGDLNDAAFFQTVAHSTSKPITKPQRPVGVRHARFLTARVKVRPGANVIGEVTFRLVILARYNLSSVSPPISSRAAHHQIERYFEDHLGDRFSVRHRIEHESAREFPPAALYQFATFRAKALLLLSRQSQEFLIGSVESSSF
jgi:hypothetical protein